MKVIGYVAIAGLLMAVQSGWAADGKTVFNQGCAGCHKTMSPKLGDKKDWDQVSKKGTDALVASVMKGKGPMPPKGGISSASQADIKAAVEYMASQAK
jgi:cytochrome c5